MRALILNSGVGKRMGHLTQTQHKSMAVLSNGETVIGRQLRLLHAHGVSHFVITLGPFAEQLMSECEAPHLAGATFSFVPNDDYLTTNYIYSMHLARSQLDDDLLVMHGDLVFSADMVGRVLTDPHPNLGLVNPSLPASPKDFKAKIVGGTIAEVSVSLQGPEAVAFQPFYKLNRQAAGAWLDRIADLIDAGKTTVYAEEALNQISDELGIHAFSYEGSFIDEVDTLDDLARVSETVRLFDFEQQPVDLVDGDDYGAITTQLALVGSRLPFVVASDRLETSAIGSELRARGPMVRFAAFSSNPKFEEVLEGLRLFRESACDSVVAVGGGSALDVAKCIKLLAAADAQVFPTPGARLERFIPLLVVPTTAGTGSESTHFAVVYVNGEKTSVAHDGIFPDWVMLAPQLLESLPPYHQRSAMIDALSQCVESSWASSATEQSLHHAMTGIRLILDQGMTYAGGRFELEAARSVLLGANHSGRAINLTKTTAPHAMSYTLTSLYGIAHGHAVGLCLVGVWWNFVHAAESDPAVGRALTPALERLAQAFGSTSTVEPVLLLARILDLLGLHAPALGSEQELTVMTDSVNQERLGNSPLPLERDQLAMIYEFVFARRLVPFSQVGSSSAPGPHPPNLG